MLLDTHHAWVAGAARAAVAVAVLAVHVEGGVAVPEVQVRRGGVVLRRLHREVQRRAAAHGVSAGDLAVPTCSWC